MHGHPTIPLSHHPPEGKLVRDARAECTSCKAFDRKDPEAKGLQNKVEVVGGERTWERQDAVSCKVGKFYKFMYMVEVVYGGRSRDWRSFTSGT
jgi:hypothetical protein